MTDTAGGRGAAGAVGWGTDLVVARRWFLGAAGLAAVAALDACSGGHGGPNPRHTIGAAPEASTTTSTSSTTLLTTPAGQSVDILILRTASSIEHYAAGVYTQLAGSGLVTTSGISDAMRFFADHHSAHGSIFEGATGRAGGTPFTQANPALSGAVEARLQALRTEADAVTLAYGVEAVAAATFAANAGEMNDPGLVPLMTGIGAVEARHLAVLGTYLAGVIPPLATTTPPYASGGFLAVTAALVPGVGLSVGAGAG